MNKLAFALAISLLSTAAFAQTTQMVFKTSDGSTHSISASGLDITFADGNMVATNGTDNLSLSLTSLISMEFSGETSGINDMVTASTAPISIININGLSLGTYSSIDEAKSALRQGIYVVKEKSGKTSKLIVR